MRDNQRRDAAWNDFETTGSIAAYLRYKGIYNAEQRDEIHTEASPLGQEIREGEPIGYC